jgi:hypothetical protein
MTILSALRKVLNTTFAVVWLASGVALAQSYDLSQPYAVQQSPAEGAATAPSGWIGPAAAAQSNSYPQGDFYTQLSAAGGSGGSYGPGGCPCNGSGGCGPDGCAEHWGCGGSPFRTGPGTCDSWRVGPRWHAELDGIFMKRDTTNLDLLADSLGTTLAAADSYENFEHGVGARLNLYSWWPQMRGYEMHVGYVGIFDWDANVIGPVAAVAVPPVGSVALSEQRDVQYGSYLHSLEINAQELTQSAWKRYGGVRYLQLGENVQSTFEQFSNAPLNLGDVSITNNTFTNAKVDNHLIGFQLGVRRDMWQLSERLSLNGFTSGGAYCNLISRKRSNVQVQNRTEILAVDDPVTPDFNEIGTTDTLVTSTGNSIKSDRTEFAFTGEVSLELVYKLNACSALKGGYQAMYLTGVELADDAYLGVQPDSDDLLLHGWFVGFEYHR